MTSNEIVRAWTDPGYRITLSPEQLAAMPANPAGELFTREEMGTISSDSQPSEPIVCQHTTITTSYFPCGTCCTSSCSL